MERRRPGPHLPDCPPGAAFDALVSETVQDILDERRRDTGVDSQVDPEVREDLPASIPDDLQDKAAAAVEEAYDIDPDRVAEIVETVQQESLTPAEADDVVERVAERIQAEAEDNEAPATGPKVTVVSLADVDAMLQEEMKDEGLEEGIIPQYADTDYGEGDDAAEDDYENDAYLDIDGTMVPDPQPQDVRLDNPVLEERSPAPAPARDLDDSIADLPEWLAEDTALQNALVNSGEQNARIEFERAMERVVADNVKTDTMLYRSYMEDPEFREDLNRRLFQELMEEAAAPEETAPEADTTAPRITPVGRGRGREWAVESTSPSGHPRFDTFSTEEQAAAYVEYLNAKAYREEPEPQLADAEPTVAMATEESPAPAEETLPDRIRNFGDTGFVDPDDYETVMDTGFDGDIAEADTLEDVETLQERDHLEENIDAALRQARDAGLNEGRRPRKAVPAQMEAIREMLGQLGRGDDFAEVAELGLSRAAAASLVGELQAVLFARKERSADAPEPDATPMPEVPPITPRREMALAQTVGLMQEAARDGGDLREVYESAKADPAHQTFVEQAYLAKMYGLLREEQQPSRDPAPYIMPEPDDVEMEPAPESSNATAGFLETLDAVGAEIPSKGKGSRVKKTHERHLRNTLNAAMDGNQAAREKLGFAVESFRDTFADDEKAISLADDIDAFLARTETDRTTEANDAEPYFYRETDVETGEVETHVEAASPEEAAEILEEIGPSEQDDAPAAVSVEMDAETGETAVTITESPPAARKPPALSRKRSDLLHVVTKGDYGEVADVEERIHPRTIQTALNAGVIAEEELAEWDAGVLLRQESRGRGKAPGQGAGGKGSGRGPCPRTG